MKSRQIPLNLVLEIQDERWNLMRVGNRGLFFNTQQPLCYLFWLWLLPMAAVGQDLCNLAGAEKGGFTLLTPAVGCSPLNVKIQDNSGGTDVVYYYYYTGETAAQLGALTPTTALENDYFAANKPTVFTILQKGKKNGRDMYACQQVTVRPNNQPLFSYTVCGSIIEINIPKDTLLNDFDFYEISWGNGTPEIVNKDDLPFSDSKTIPASKRIKVEGFFNTNPLNCASPAFITIPTYTPSNFPAGYDKTNHPNIEVIELLEKGKANLHIKGSLAETGYDLFMTTPGQNYSAVPILSGVKPGEVLVDLPDTVNQYCFKIQRRVPNCGIEVSGEMCTNTLESVTPREKDYEVVWQVYPEEMTGIPNAPAFGRVVSHTETLTITSNGVAKPAVGVDTNQGQFISTVDCTERVCYKIETEVVGQLFYHAFGGKSISNEICVDRKNFTPPAITDAHSTVTSPDNVTINYVDNSGWNLTKEKFRLLRFDGDTFIPVDSTNTAASFTDSGVNTADASYCYQINYTDECGSTSAASPTFCTIYLTEAETNTLGWTPESPYAADNPTTYDIIYFDEATGNPIIETASPFPTATHPINLDLFEEFARYQIKAIDANGVESLSNILEIPIQASIFLPTAFTPNGDGINDELQVKGNTKRIVAYQLTLYNRWGETIFNTTEVGAVWNGTAGAALAPSGNYTYRIEATTNTGEIIQKKGTVFLVR